MKPGQFILLASTLTICYNWRKRIKISSHQRLNQVGGYMGNCIISGCANDSVARQLCGKDYQVLKRRNELPDTERSLGIKSSNPLYPTYKAMLARCYRPTCKDYDGYGGRGITVCERWRGYGGFWNFVEDMGERPFHRSLDRIDNDKGYSPNNCRWADYSTQSLNRRPASTKRKGLSRGYKRAGFKASITLNSIKIDLGTFKSIEEADDILDKAERQCINLLRLIVESH